MLNYYLFRRLIIFWQKVVRLIPYAGESEAYPKEAVQAYHEKPMPTHQVGANNKPKIIQQPKK
jgi:hypothetical protein